MKYRIITIILTLVILGGLASVLVLNNQEAQAIASNLDTSKFNEGYIIDDYTFTDHTTMTAEEIQQFLEDNIFGGQCDRNKDNPYTETKDGPYTCLFEFQQNTLTGENNYGLFDEDGDPLDIEDGLTAAEIIYQAANDHKINPQVLLVLLQKEQSLISDNWPLINQFAKATGYACPDFAACDPAVADFYHQIDRAAWQFRQYIENLDNYWYIIGDNQILYHPNSACGSKTVNFKNKATIALYLYTPYVPNQAALNNFYGVGDHCSSYGNRNFWAYFNFWFGPSINNVLANIPPDTTEVIEKNEKQGLNFELKSIKVFKDDTKSELLNLDNIIFENEDTAYVSIQVVNTGGLDWSQDDSKHQIVLTAYADENYRSQMCSLIVSNKYCPSTVSLKEEIVESGGGIGTFEFAIKVPAIASIVNQTFQLKHNDTYLDGIPINIILSTNGNKPNININEEFIPEKNETKKTDSEEDQTPTQEEETPTPTDSDTASETETIPVNDDNQPTQVVLPANWASMSVIEKIQANPWGCHDTTKIRADNGQCLSGGYTIPQSSVTNTQTPTQEEETPTPTDSDTASETETIPVNDDNQPTQVVLPANWASMSVIEKIQANPWGCHDTTKIRADNGQCLSGGYTIPQSSVTNTQTPTQEEETPTPTDSDTASETETIPVNDDNQPTQVVLPANWASMSVIEKIQANPWGCHDTTKIRADNGQCLSGGYTIPQTI